MHQPKAGRSIREAIKPNAENRRGNGGLIELCKKTYCKALPSEATSYSVHGSSAQKRLMTSLLQASIFVLMNCSGTRSTFCFFKYAAPPYVVTFWFFRYAAPLTVVTAPHPLSPARHPSLDSDQTHLMGSVNPPRRPPTAGIARPKAFGCSDLLGLGLLIWQPAQETLELD